MKIDFENHANFKRGMNYTNLDVAVAFNGLTTIAEIPVGGFERGFIQFSVAEQALDQFVISARATKAAPWSELYSTSLDYESPRGLIIGLSGDLSAQAAGTVGDMLLDLRGLYEIRLQASSSNAAGSIVSTYGGAA